ncbi:MAG: hypothetical protein JWN25_2022, partial [Verrucomicrobiales bacterium]|nr:hypothetical protein [Verrucomicrobiales bacterium]
MGSVLALITAAAPNSASAASAGGAVIWGQNNNSQQSIVAPPAGVTYVDIGVSDYSGVGLRSDGQIVGWGNNSWGQITPPALPAGVTYTQVSVGRHQTVALRSDGQAVGFGYTGVGSANFAALPAGKTYTQVASGYLHNLLLRSDGQVFAAGYNSQGEINIPALPAGLTYTFVAAGFESSFAIRSDGSAIGWGQNDYGQLTIPALPAGVTYKKIAGGRTHTIFLRSDGQVVGSGNTADGSINVPALPAGVTYVDISAGYQHSLALRSDKVLVAFGNNSQGQTTVPALSGGNFWKKLGSATAAYGSAAISVQSVIFTVNGSAANSILLGSTFTDPGVTAVDINGNALTVTASGTVNGNVVGKYILTYSATDSGGNVATTSRTVSVVKKLPTDLWVAMMPSYTRSQTYANAALNEPITVWGRAWNGTAPYSYVLDFGDGSATVTASGLNATAATFIGASHAYSSSGSKTATLTVSDSAGHSVSRTSVIRVLATPTHDDRVNMAIEKGLIYLYKNQIAASASKVYWPSPWTSASREFISTLGAALMSFEENGHLAKYDYEDEIYAETVQKGLNYVVDSGLGAYFAIAPHSDGIAVRNSDSNGNGKGAYLCTLGYANALGTVALVMSVNTDVEAKNTFVETGPFAGVSYYDLVTDIMDQLTYAQGDGGNRGGWVYDINTTDNGRYDGSAQQWPSLVFKVTKDRWGISAQSWTVANAVFGFQQVQDPTGGGAGYSDRSWLNHAKTGGMLVSYDFGGKVVGDVDVNKGIKFIGDNWYSQINTGSGQNNGGWVGGELYAMYGVKKGLQLQGVSTVATSAGARDWYQDLSAWLLGDASLLDPNLGNGLRSQSANAFGQYADGHWETSMWPVGQIGSPAQPLQTSFAILTLTKAVTVALPVAVIAPVPDQSSKNPGVTMDGSGSYHTDSSLSIVEYLWDWNAANGVDWTHPDATGTNPRNPGYTTPGDYTVTLRVKDNSTPAQFATATVKIHVIDTDVPPVAIAIPAGSPGYAGKIGDVITLDGSASYDPDGDVITDYSWDLNGDGVFGDAHGVNPTVTFSSEYSGEVRLQVTANGKTAKSTATVSIAGSSSDLYVSSISAANVVLGTNADIHVVLNSDVNSTKSFNNVSVKFYNNNPLSGGIQVGSNYTVNLPAGGSAVIDAHLTGIGSATNIYAYVDATKSIPEWDELNNVMGVGILNQRPTISCASDVTAEATSLAGASVDVTVGVNDVDSDPLTVQWFIDNALAESYTLPAGSTSATLSSVYAYGSHSVKVVVTDG